jgi:hypothetical protein
MRTFGGNRSFSLYLLTVKKNLVPPSILTSCHCIKSTSTNMDRRGTFFFALNPHHVSAVVYVVGLACIISIDIITIADGYHYQSN